MQDVPAAELLGMYSEIVYRLAYSRTQNRHDAEDITQDVFLKYIKSAPRFNCEEHRKAWLLKVTVNASKSLVTSAWVRRRANIDDAENMKVDFSQKNELYYTVIKLPQKYRIVVHLFYYEQLSVLQISELLNRKESTIKSQLFRARKMLRKLLEEEQYEL